MKSADVTPPVAEVDAALDESSDAVEYMEAAARIIWRLVDEDILCKDVNDV